MELSLKVIGSSSSFGKALLDNNIFFKPYKNLAEHVYLVLEISLAESTTMYGFLSLNDNTNFFSFHFILSFVYVYEMRNYSFRRMNSVIKYLTSFYYNTVCQKKICFCLGAIVLQEKKKLS